VRGWVLVHVLNTCTWHSGEVRGGELRLRTRYYSERESGSGEDERHEGEKVRDAWFHGVRIVRRAESTFCELSWIQRIHSPSPLVVV